MLVVLPLVLPPCCRRDNYDEADAIPVGTKLAMDGAPTGVDHQRDDASPDSMGGYCIEPTAMVVHTVGRGDPDGDEGPIDEDSTHSDGSKTLLDQNGSDCSDGEDDATTEQHR
jgi:hypothetical protein